jgi:hypothetical protein
MDMSVLFVRYVICTETKKYTFELVGSSFVDVYVILEPRIRLQRPQTLRGPHLPPLRRCLCCNAACKLPAVTRATAEPLILQLQPYIVQPSLSKLFVVRTFTVFKYLTHLQDV